MVGTLWERLWNTTVRKCCTRVAMRPPLVPPGAADLPSGRFLQPLIAISPFAAMLRIYDKLGYRIESNWSYMLGNLSKSCNGCRCGFVSIAIRIRSMCYVRVCRLSLRSKCAKRSDLCNRTRLDTRTAAERPRGVKRCSRECWLVRRIPRIRTRASHCHPSRQEPQRRVAGSLGSGKTTSVCWLH